VLSFFYENCWNAFLSKIEFEDWLTPSWSECGELIVGLPLGNMTGLAADVGVSIELIPQFAGPLLEVLEPR
jgi:hypothetical protein